VIALVPAAQHSKTPTPKAWTKGTSEPRQLTQTLHAETRPRHASDTRGCAARDTGGHAHLRPPSVAVVPRCDHRRRRLDHGRLQLFRPLSNHSGKNPLAAVPGSGSSMMRSRAAGRANALTRSRAPPPSRRRHAGWVRVLTLHQNKREMSVAATSLSSTHRRGTPSVIPTAPQWTAGQQHCPALRYSPRRALRETRRLVLTRIDRSRKTAGQAPFVTGSRIATHSTCEVIENTSRQHRRLPPPAQR
jgi:hypothetical protein